MQLHHNFTTHHKAWRDAILLAIEYTKFKTYVTDIDSYNQGVDPRAADLSYWEHELKAFDESYSEDGIPKYEEEVVEVINIGDCVDFNYLNGEHPGEVLEIDPVDDTYLVRWPDDSHGWVRRSVIKLVTRG